ncbi:MAG: hypothetical protein IH810_04890 [Proteobacteria bacterium]|nr:hypothetical protein [Pseudomonadota bacterium]
MKSFLDTEFEGFTWRERLQFAVRTIRNNPKLALTLGAIDLAIGVVIAVVVLAAFC